MHRLSSSEFRTSYTPSSGRIRTAPGTSFLHLPCDYLLIYHVEFPSLNLSMRGAYKRKSSFQGGHSGSQPVSYLNHVRLRLMQLINQHPSIIPHNHSFHTYIPTKYLPNATHRRSIDLCTCDWRYLQNGKTRTRPLITSVIFVTGPRSARCPAVTPRHDKASEVGRI